MGYSKNMRASAYRHYLAAEALNGTHRSDVAGYLYGVAAECALKQIMIDSGMRELPVTQRRDDPFYSHYEELKTKLRDTARGRLAGKIFGFAKRADFMQYWSTDMRYSSGKDIQAKWIENWRKDSQDIIAEMEC